MIKKAGCVLVNIETRQVGLVYRNKKNDYSFPKGHLEMGETLEECAIRETEEETCRKCKIVSNKELGVIKYITKSENEVEVYMYLAIDLGETTKVIEDKLKEVLVWKDIEDVENTLSYDNLNKA